jgi:hypothetical protein
LNFCTILLDIYGIDIIKKIIEDMYLMAAKAAFLVEAMRQGIKICRELLKWIFLSSAVAVLWREKSFYMKCDVD